MGYSSCSLMRFKTSYQHCFTGLEPCKRNDPPVVCWGCEKKCLVSSVNLEGRHGREEILFLTYFFPLNRDCSVCVHTVQMKQLK